MKNWDDLRIFLAVARCGSITAGATQLGLDQSTVSRKLQSFEDRLSLNLFIGSAKRNTLSPSGQRIFEGAARLEKEVEDINQNIAGLSEEQGGTIHIVTTDILSNHLLMSVTSEFLQKYPDINLRIRTQDMDGKDISNNPLPGDLALYATNTPNEDLFGRKLATATFASYASRNYLDSLKDDFDKIVWLNWDDGTATPTWPRLAPDIPDHMCRLRSDSVATLLESVRFGIGATILPCFIGEQAPNLVRLTPGQTVSQRDIWLLMHKDLRHVPRIRTFIDFFVQRIKERKGIIESD
ncbi:LysR family transcriptional regulator [Kiloniella majae]|uniref:LysR family transcriptional regulator n=1 Tax=Kiloniella majae TaxID=1938558 RepID=UPI000A27804C|nr:LysR family transcriptional regulator [Kiloniella majae]